MIRLQLDRHDFGRAAVRIFLGTLLLGFLIPSVPLSAQTGDSSPAAEVQERDQIQKTITLLEDDDRRKEVVTLLKLMAALEAEKGPAGPSAEAVAPADDPGTAPGLKGYLQNAADEALRAISSSGVGLRQTWGEIRTVFKALATPRAVDMWRPYLLKVCVWGLICLTVTWIIIRKYGRPPAACYSCSLGERARALGKYILIVAGPNLVLIISLLALPSMSSTAPGVTVDMATGFAFLRALSQHFFVNLSVLYICLRLAAALFSPGDEGRPLINIHPILARHFLHSWRVFAVYLALFIFIQESFLENFVTGVLYSLALVIMTIPIPVYLTLRLAKLRRLVHAISEAEASAGSVETEAEALVGSDQSGDLTPDLPARLEYRADGFIRRNWGPLAIASVWILSLVSLVNPADATRLFAWRCLGSLILGALLGLAVKGSRILMLRLVDRDIEHGRRLILNVDSLVNLLAWIVLALGLLSIWGFPLGRFLENELTREVLSRALAIVITVTALVLFIRFSRLATEWLLSVPDLGQNRNWRTMTPLILTAVRSLAIFVGVVVILERLGVNIGPILAGAGILGLGVGMGAQSLVKDVINGVSILLMDTLAVGDYVTIGGMSGTVEALGLRTIRLRDSAGNLTVVPNSSVDTIVNMTRDYSQDLVEFTVPYDADPDAMLKLAREVAEDLSGDPAWRRYLTGPVTVVGVVGFDANGTTIRLKINTTAGDQWSVGRELRLRLKRRMLQEGLKSTWFGQNVFYFRGDSPADEPPGSETAPTAPPLAEETGK